MATIQKYVLTDYQFDATQYDELHPERLIDFSITATDAEGSGFSYNAEYDTGLSINLVREDGYGEDNFAIKTDVGWEPIEMDEDDEIFPGFTVADFEEACIQARDGEY